MLRCADEKFSAMPNVQGKEIAKVMEITMNNLKAAGEIDRRDFLARADVIAACGMPVLISDYFQYYRLAAYLSGYTKEPIAITMGAASMMDLFDEQYYTGLQGGVLESFGRLFKNDLKIFCYPMKDRQTGEIVTSDNLQFSPELQQLYGYLTSRGDIISLDNFDASCLDVFSRDVLERIKRGDSSWESMVPEAVAEVIKSKAYFGLES
jgi:hypothetical protein